MKKAILFTLLCLLQLFAGNAGIQQFSQEIITALNLAPGDKISATVLEEDRKYMLTLAPVMDDLREELSKNLTVSLNSADGSAIAVFYELLETKVSTGGVQEGAGANMGEDTLILSGSYQVESNDLVYCTVELTTTSQKKLCEETFEIQRESASAAYKSKLFSKISDEYELKDVQYAGKVIEKLDNLLNSAGNRVLFTGEPYRIERIYPYALVEQEAIFRSILTRKYGITESATAKGKISILNGGIVSVEHGTERAMLANMIEGESMFGDDFSDEMMTMGVPNTNPITQAIVYEPVPYEDPTMVKVKESIVKTFEVDYPKLFEPFSVSGLKGVFKGGDVKRIFVGKVLESDPSTGREKVQYNYITRDQWLGGLQKSHKNGRTFKVDTKVMNIYRDQTVKNRYFAVVKQGWDTNFRGRTVYHDDGFLIVSFDYDFVKNRARSFSIHQRLWFYDYKYDDREGNITRVTKLQRDLDDYFVNVQMQGISSDLKSEIRNLIVREANKLDIKLKNRALRL